MKGSNLINDWTPENRDNKELVKWFWKLNDFGMGNDVSSVLSGGYKGFNNVLSFGNDWEVLRLD